jgi:hypothetical protein
MAPVSPADDALLEAAKTLSPDKSIERIESHAKYLFTLVGTVGTLLTGFSLFSTNNAFARAPELLRWPLTLVCASLALAMLALTPWPSRVDRDNLIELRTFLNARLLWRGLAVLFAGLLFAAALMSVTFAGGRPAPGVATDGSTSLTVTRGEKGDEVKASVKVKALPPGAELNIDAQAVMADGTMRTLMSRRTTVQHGGEAGFDVSIPAIAGTQELRVVTTAKAREAMVYQESAVVAVEPRPVVPAPKAPKTAAKK